MLKYIVRLALALGLISTVTLVVSPTIRADVLSRIREIGGMTFNEVDTWPEDYPPLPSPEEMQEEMQAVTEQVISIEQAQAMIPFEVPTWMPEGYEFIEVTVPTVHDDSGSTTLPSPSLVWQSSGGTIHLHPTTSDSSSSEGFAVGTGALEEVLVNGQPAVLVRGAWSVETGQYNLEGDGFRMMHLVFNKGQVRYNISFGGIGPVSEQDLIQIAESIP